MAKRHDSFAGGIYRHFCMTSLLEYRETGNPLYAWRGFRFWLQGQASGYKWNRFEMPFELRAFLEKTSTDLHSLAWGNRPPEYQDGKQGAPGKNEPPLAPGKALALLPEALRLRAGKWEAFSEYRRAGTAKHLGDLFSEIREAGTVYKEAHDALAERIGLKDEREARRKMSGKPRGAAKRPPWRDGAE